MPSNATERRVGLTQYLGMYSAKEQKWIDDQIEKDDRLLEKFMLTKIIFPQEALFENHDHVLKIEWICTDDSSRSFKDKQSRNKAKERSESPGWLSCGRFNLNLVPIFLKVLLPIFLKRLLPIHSVERDHFQSKRICIESIVESNLEIPVIKELRMVKIHI